MRLYLIAAAALLAARLAAQAQPPQPQPQPMPADNHPDNYRLRREHQRQKIPSPPPGQVSDDHFLTFLFGMKAEQAKQRYELKVTREDQYYIYLDVTPRSPQDRSDFVRAQLVLSKESFLPRQLWFEQPNGSTIV